MVRFNDVPVQQISLDEVRKAVYYVPQHPRLFNRTLWDNIRYGQPTTQGQSDQQADHDTLRPESVLTVLERLDMAELAAVFRRKMHEPVGKQGSYLSGGQRQIVLLLRAIFSRDAKVLILDEPTSALDAISRDQVIRLVLSAATHRTLIVITHDRELADKMGTVYDMQQSKPLPDP